LTARPGPALAASDLRVVYQRGFRGMSSPALDGINTRIPAGSLTALVGPNGAGKSTLMRTWVGFEKPSAGAVRVHGTDPWASGAARLVGFVPQRPHLHPQMSASDYCAAATAWRPGFDSHVALQRLGETGVDASRPVGRLSGGQQAQVALALTLGTGAPVLLLDEPLAHLDPLSRRDFLMLVASHASEHGTTVLLSSHILSDIALICDRLLLLNEGSTLLDLSVAEALSTHRVVPVGAPNPQPAEAIGQSDAAGLETLVRWSSGSPEIGREPSLDELVIGHLQAARSIAKEASR
jgi:ABC-2 type transport system ATP-binding protein